MYDISHRLTLYTSSQCFNFLFLSPFSLAGKSNRHANRMLGIFLFAQLMIIFDFECYHLPGHLWLAHVLIYFWLEPHSSCSLGTAFYLYVKSLVFSDFRLQRKHIFHALPFVLCHLLFAFEFYFLPMKSKMALLQRHCTISRDLLDSFQPCCVCPSLAYFLGDLSILKHYRNEIRQQYSSITRYQPFMANFYSLRIYHCMAVKRSRFSFTQLFLEYHRRAPVCKFLGVLFLFQLYLL